MTLMSVDLSACELKDCPVLNEADIDSYLTGSYQSSFGEYPQINLEGHILIRQSCLCP